MFDVYSSAVTVAGAGTALRIAVHGPREGIPVLMLHGFPDSAHLWRHQVRVLAAEGYRVIAPDLRGFGGSGCPEDVHEYTLRKHAEDVRRILESLDVESAHIVGHDWGAALTWYLGIVAPDLIRTAAVLSVGHPTVFASAGLEQRQRSWYMLLFQFEGVAEQWLSRDEWRWMREWSGNHEEMEHWIGELSRPGALTAALNIYRANMAPPTWAAPPPQLPPMQCDVLGVWSTGDSVLLEPQMSDSGEYVSGRWRYERIEGANHWIPLSATDRLNELLLEWLP